MYASPQENAVLRHLNRSYLHDAALPMPVEFGDELVDVVELIVHKPGDAYFQSVGWVLPDGTVVQDGERVVSWAGIRVFRKPPQRRNVPWWARSGRALGRAGYDRVLDERWFVEKAVVPPADQRDDQRAEFRRLDELFWEREMEHVFGS